MLTEQQQTILDSLSSFQSISVTARAGTGKTYTLCQTAPRLKSGLAIAFNKSIATELQSRSELSSWECKTFNALGFQECRSRNIFKTDTKKLDRLVEPAYKYPESVFVKKVIDWFKSAAVMPKDASVELFFQFISDHEELPQDWEEENLFEHASQIHSIFHDSVNDRSCIDFSDQIYFPVAFGWSLEKYHSILVDESQDLSPLQQKFIHMLKGPNTQIVTFGDPRQCIYTFRGADSNAFYNLANSLDSEILPLSYSFRCPKSIVREANVIESDFFAFPSNPEGKVSHTSPDNLFGTITSFGAETAVLCRTNAPLIPFALELMRKNRPFTFKGAFPRRLQAFFYKLDRAQARSKIQKTERELGNMSPGRAAAMQDLLEAASMILERTSSRSDISAFITALQTPSNGTFLSTIHQSKGLEFPRVFFLRSATLDLSDVGEQNLFYVAVTRSKDKLTFVN